MVQLCCFLLRGMVFLRGKSLQHAFLNVLRWNVTKQASASTFFCNSAVVMLFKAFNFCGIYSLDEIEITSMRTIQDLWYCISGTWATMRLLQSSLQLKNTHFDKGIFFPCKRGRNELHRSLFPIIILLLLKICFTVKNQQCKRWEELFNNFGSLMCIILISNTAKQRSELLFLGINKIHVMHELQLIVVDIQL